MSIMRPDNVYKYTTIGYFDSDHEGLSGSSIGPVKSITPEAPKKQYIENILSDYFSQNDSKNLFYRQCRHFCSMSKSKKDAKEQFEKVIELYFLSLKNQYPNEKDTNEINTILENIDTIVKLLDNFSKDGRMENDYFGAALAALLVSLL